MPPGYGAAGRRLQSGCLRNSALMLFAGASAAVLVVVTRAVTQQPGLGAGSPYDD